MSDDRAVKRSVSILHLNVGNVRHANPALNKIDAIEKNMRRKPHRFKALWDDLLDVDGFSSAHPVVCIKKDGKYIVMDGNRRVSAMKLLLGEVKAEQLKDQSLRRRVSAILKNVTDTWKEENKSIWVVTVRDLAAAWKIMKRNHTGDDAGVEPWDVIQQRRGMQTFGGAEDPCLDIFDHFLESDFFKKSVEDGLFESKESFEESFSFSVFATAVIPHYLKVCGQSLKSLSSLYLSSHMEDVDRAALDGVILDIGLEKIQAKVRGNKGFPDTLRNTYGVRLITNERPKNTDDIDLSGGNGGTIGGDDTVGTCEPPGGGNYGGESGDDGSSSGGGDDTGTGGSSGTGGGTSGGGRVTPADSESATNRLIRSLNPRRDVYEAKIATLLREIARMKKDDLPHSFAIVVRSIVHLSVDCFFKKYGLSLRTDKCVKLLAAKVTEIFEMIRKDLPQEDSKIFLSAKRELCDGTRVLSITNMNDITHTGTVVTGNAVRSAFYNVEPFLRFMYAYQPPGGGS